MAPTNFPTHGDEPQTTGGLSTIPTGEAAVPAPRFDQAPHRGDEGSASAEPAPPSWAEGGHWVPPPFDNPDVMSSGHAGTQAHYPPIERQAEEIAEATTPPAPPSTPHDQAWPEPPAAAYRPEPTSPAWPQSPATYQPEPTPAWPEPPVAAYQPEPTPAWPEPPAAAYQPEPTPAWPQSAPATYQPPAPEPRYDYSFPPDHQPGLAEPRTPAAASFTPPPVATTTSFDPPTNPTGAPPIPTQAFAPPSASDPSQPTDVWDQDGFGATVTPSTGGPRGGQPLFPTTGGGGGESWYKNPKILIPTVAGASALVIAGLWLALSGPSEPKAAQVVPSPPIVQTVTATVTVTAKAPDAGPGAAVPVPGATLQPTPTGGVPAAASVPDGTYVIGQDIQPGQYRVARPLVTGTCAVTINDEGGLTTANQTWTTGTPTYTVPNQPGRTFESMGCGGWVKAG